MQHIKQSTAFAMNHKRRARGLQRVESKDGSLWVVEWVEMYRVEGPMWTLVLKQSKISM